MSGTGHDAPDPELIPQEVLDHAYRKLCRRIAAHLLVGMAEADVGFPEIATRLDAREANVRGWFRRLADGEGGDFRKVTALAAAMRMELLPEARPMPLERDAAP